MYTRLTKQNQYFIHSDSAKAMGQFWARGERRHHSRRVRSRRPNDAGVTSTSRAPVRSTFDRRVDMSARAHADVAEAWPTRPQRDFDASMRCGICGDFYEMPVSFRGCHHAFCSDCVRRALPVMEKCPTCREPAEERDLVPNKALEHAVECYKRVRDELLGTTLAERDARARGEREGTTTTTMTTTLIRRRTARKRRRSLCR